MTLHSVACAYAENPTHSERELMSSWLDMFRDTITCPSCQGHFRTLLANYRNKFPNMLQSRHEFVMFTFRAHNAVNRRLKKPVYNSVEECMTTLRNNVATKTAKQYREAYIAHITRHWKVFQDMSGLVALRKIQEMKRIESEYIGQRDTNFTLTLRPDIVVLAQTMLEQSSEQPVQRPVYLGTGNATAGFRITAGGLRLRR
jgi:hypothetical protein